VVGEIWLDTGASNSLYGQFDSVRPLGGNNCLWCGVPNTCIRFENGLN
jgi:hypothetical protein